MKKDDLKTLIKGGEPLLIADVREKWEFNEADSHIEGAENIPMGEMFVRAKRNMLPKDTKIITICRSGARAQVVARELTEMGFDIDFLEGGMFEWDKENTAS